MVNFAALAQLAVLVVLAILLSHSLHYLAELTLALLGGLRIRDDVTIKQIMIRSAGNIKTLLISE